MIADEHGRFRAAERYREHESNVAEILRVGRRDVGTSEEILDPDEETMEELEIAETTDGGEEDIFRTVIGQATEELWKQEYSESADDADSESLGNGESR